MKRNDKAVAYVGVSFINVCARFSTRHRRVVVDEKVIAVQGYSHDVDWRGESEFCSLLLRTFRSARDRRYRTPDEHHGEKHTPGVR
jgi:hypothetical protein